VPLHIPQRWIEAMRASRRSGPSAAVMRFESPMFDKKRRRQSN